MHLNDRLTVHTGAVPFSQSVDADSLTPRVFLSTPTARKS